MHPRKTALSVLVAANAVLLVAGTGPALGQATHTVELTGVTFSPADLTVDMGDTVHWVWVDGFHNVESGVDGSHDGNFRSGDPTGELGTTFDIVFDEGFLDAHPMPDDVYPYYCAVHLGAGMTGTITVARGPCQLTELGKLTASDPSVDDFFGHSVSISDDTALIGAPEQSGSPTEGAAYVYRFDGAKWIEEATLTAADGAVGDRFGLSVAISADAAVIHGAGSVYVFRRNDKGWLEEAKLTPSDGSWMTGTVSISGDVVVAGASTDDAFTGAAYVFRFDGGDWIEEAKLTASDATEDGRFGKAVSADGGVVVVGAGFCHPIFGCTPDAAYVFRFDGTDWIEEAKVTPSDAPSGWFGWSVSVSGDAVLVGARDDDDGGFNSGAAYVFRFDGTDWIEEAKLTASDAATMDRLGVSVSVSGDVALIGAQSDDDGGPNSGSAYVFRFDGADWIEEAKLFNVSSGVGLFGSSVAISGSSVVIGEPFDNEACPDDDANCRYGSAHILRGLADCNLNGGLDACEIADGSAQDCQPDGVPDECQLPGNDEIPPGGDGVPDDCNCAGDADCDDGDVCTGTESCNLDTLLCEPGTPLNTDDTVDCTIDTCDPIEGVIHTPDDSFCDDENQCTIDHCDVDSSCMNDAAAADGTVCGGGGGECQGGICVGVCFLNELAELNASDADTGDKFGDAVSIDGDVAVIGAHWDDTPWSASGSTYVFRYNGTDWIEEAKLTASDGAEGDQFGLAVSVSGDVAVIGAPWNDDVCPQDPVLCNSGAAYVFRFDGGNWGEQVKLTASDAARGDHFGDSVSVYNDVVLVSAPYDDDACPDDPPCNSGAVFVFRFDGANWVEEAKLTASDAGPSWFFGGSGVHDNEAVALNGNVAVIGAYPSASAYVFRFDGTDWIEEAKLTASDADTGDRFGASVSVSGGVAVIGAYFDEVAGSASGSAYVFRFDGVDWVEESKLTASDGEWADYFGRSVSIAGDVVVVGANGDDDGCPDDSNCMTGSAYMFRFDGARWVEQGKLTAAEAAEVGAWLWVGSSVSISGDVALVGAAWGRNDADVAGGSAYVFRGLSDCNENDELDACDIADGSSDDSDGSGIPDECELSIVSSSPPDGAIDARQPTDVDGFEVYGWSDVVLTFDADVTGLTPDDFTVTVDPPTAPPFLAFVHTAGSTATLQFGDFAQEPIPPGHWTIITHNASDTSARIGYLPADVNADRTSSPRDILALIDALNGVGEALPIWSTDMNRSGAANSADILRLIDLLNGGAETEGWNGRTLPD